MINESSVGIYNSQINHGEGAKWTFVGVNKQLNIQSLQVSVDKGAFNSDPPTDKLCHRTGHV